MTPNHSRSPASRGTTETRGRSGIGTLLVLATLLLHGAPAPAAAQVGSAPQFDHTSAPVATAVRTTAAPDIDGTPDEEVWFAAPALTEFTQIEPNEWAPVSERTEVRILYDDYNLYVAAWLYDSGPLTPRLGRRDSGWPDTDGFIFFVDTYHDHRTAYRFTLNPAGTKRDEIVTVGGSNTPGRGGPSGTGFGDTSWDPVWDSATSITEEGWFVEMRVPFGQLGYGRGDVQHWGMQVDRRIGRKAEHASWAFTPALERATVARFGHLQGIEGIRSTGRLEMLPFVASRAEYRRIAQNAEAGFDNPYRSGSDLFGDVGIDLKYRISSNLTLNGTINPDFGQVEMDAAEINLSAFETRLNERRPFFVEGAEIFGFGQQGGMNTQLLYTRRIGRAPQGSVPSAAVYSDVPGATTILGALKLSGKTQGGWSLGVLQALTNRESAEFIDVKRDVANVVVEPMTHYLAVRARRDLQQGRTAVGVVATAVNRDLGAGDPLATRLHTSAYTGGIDFRHDRPGRTWSFSGEFTPSFVFGETLALRRTQMASARYFQRPDARHLDLDPDATSLFGYGAKLDASKESGAWRGGVTLTAISPAFEVNDIGFQTNADRLDVRTSIGYDRGRPGTLFRRWNVGSGPNMTWNYDGDLLAADVGLNAGGQLVSYHMVNFRLFRSFETWNDRMTRGGPLVRDPSSWGVNANFNSDNRMKWTFRLGGGFNSVEGGGWRWNLGGGITGKPSESAEIRINPSVNRSRTIAQYVTARDDANATDTFGRRYVFATIDQTTVSLDTRLNVTFTPKLTLELFAEPFVSSGDYGKLKELAAPRTYSFLEYGRDIGTVEHLQGGRIRVDPDGPEGSSPAFTTANQDFNFGSLLGNAVLRWEWRPGSTLFLVWQQSRSERLSVGDGLDRPIGRVDLDRDARALLGIRPENIFMVKVSYWLNP